MKFTEFNLDDTIIKAIDDAGYEECMPVQEMTFPYGFQGKDIFVQSQTGSGKTAAFMITIFYRLLHDETLQGRTALIVAPTRELADQIGKEAEMLGKYLDFKIGVFFGGVGYGKQEKLLAQGVDIIIGTPGRLIDFSDSGKINLKKIGIFVIDEADRLFDMGFYPDIKKMLKKMPPQMERQTMLFSATLDDRVKHIAGSDMNSPVEINLTPDQITVENIEQKLYHVGTDEKINLLLGILKRDNPGNAIIFTNTKYKAVEISKRLAINGYNCEFLMGDLPQTKRLSVIDRIKSGELRFLIATDVAARGLHIDDLDMVINYDLPEHSENYVHRIGRTARAGKSGKAISLACEKFVYGLESIESLIDMKIPVEWPEDELFEADKSRGMHLHIEDETRPGGKRKGDHKTISRKKKPADRRPHEEKPRTGERKPSRAGSRPAKKEETPRPRQKERDTRPKPVKRPKPESSLEERLAYYSKKYGDTFETDMPQGKGKPAMSGKKGIVGKIFGFLKRKNK
ncbi:MAG TPA: DEAD/DEAH box helicase [Spirochaetota bacterium]|nr:DEAD/DEAH box helicase [Spirochaetota bacterium]